MEKLFILGNAPLPIDVGVSCQTAFGLRTWQFLSVAKNFPGKIRIILLLEKKHYKKSPILNKVLKKEVFGAKIEVLYLEKNSGNFFSRLKQSFNDFSPTVCAGINLNAAYFLSQLKPSIPFWADLNGWSGGEAQSQSYAYQDDAYISEIWKKEKNILKTADKISVVSHPQKYITIGQLAALGRMNHKTEYQEFVSVIPNGNETRKIVSKISKRKKFILRGDKIPEKSFIVFFSGAYNTWLDEENLFEGIEKAMKKNSDLFFVSTGSGVKGFSNKIFDQFISRVKASKFSDRFVFLGWIEKEDLLDCYEQVDVAINLDRRNLESKVGARNRINEWLVYGVPVMSTIMSEISKDLLKNDLLIPVKVENLKNLAEQLEVAQKVDLKVQAKRAKAFAEKEYSYQKTVKPFAEFLKNPEISPDRGYRLNMKPNIFKKLAFRVKNDGFGVVADFVLKKMRIKK